MYINGTGSIAAWIFKLTVRLIVSCLQLADFNEIYLDTRLRHDKKHIVVQLLMS